MPRVHLLPLVLLLALPAAPRAAPLEVELLPSPANPARPRMGDRLVFRSVIRNGGADAVEGPVAWPTLVRVDRGNEQPVDLEDWSASKALAVPALGPGQTLEADWPLRLIQSGDYRLAVSAASRGGASLAASPFADFTVARKEAVESRRVLPVAIGVPLLLGSTFLLRRRRREGRP